MPPEEAARTRALQTELRTVLGLPGARVEPWRRGTDFIADLVYDGSALLGVLRSPRVERRPTSYEGLVDFGEVLTKEAVAAALLAGSAVPVPRVLRVHRSRSPGRMSWSLAEFIDSEDDFPVAPVLSELGMLTRAIHGIRPDTEGLRPQRSWPDYFTTRLAQRLTAAGRYTGLPVDDGFLDRVRALLDGRVRAADRLLHMDLRPANLCVRAGRIVGVLDLGNCLVGDPLLELARIRAYGLLDADFRRGYGTGHPHDHHEAALLDVYQLDTEALLVAVAAEEVGDPGLLREKIRATRELCARINRPATGNPGP